MGTNERGSSAQKAGHGNRWELSEQQRERTLRVRDSRSAAKDEQLKIARKVRLVLPRDHHDAGSGTTLCRLGRVMMSRLRERNVPRRGRIVRTDVVRQDYRRKEDKSQCEYCEGAH